MVFLQVCAGQVLIYYLLQFLIPSLEELKHIFCFFISKVHMAFLDIFQILFQVDILVLKLLDDIEEILFLAVVHLRGACILCFDFCVFGIMRILAFGCAGHLWRRYASGIQGFVRNVLGFEVMLAGYVLIDVHWRDVI